MQVEMKKEGGRTASDSVYTSTCGQIFNLFPLECFNVFPIDYRVYSVFPIECASSNCLLFVLKTQTPSQLEQRFAAATIHFPTVVTA